MEYPNPQPLGAHLSIDDVDDYKRCNCIRYSTCLDRAQGWIQFHCNDCSAYVRREDGDPENAVFTRIGRRMAKAKNGTKVLGNLATSAVEVARLADLDKDVLDEDLDGDADVDAPIAAAIESDPAPE